MNNSKPKGRWRGTSKLRVFFTFCREELNTEVADEGDIIKCLERDRILAASERETHDRQHLVSITIDKIA